VRAGTTVALRCKASGNPPPKITWQKRNDRLPPGEISGKEFFCFQIKSKPFSKIAMC